MCNEITWVVFRVNFLEKYFYKDLRSKMEIQFLELKLGDSTVAEYATKFENLMNFYLHYKCADAEGSECIKFKSGLRPKIKQGIGYQEILRYSVLGNKCIINDADRRARSYHYQSFSAKKGRDHNRGNLYSASTDKRKQKVDQKDTGGK